MLEAGLTTGETRLRVENFLPSRVCGLARCLVGRLKRHRKRFLQVTVQTMN